MTRVSKPQWALTWQVIFSIVVGLAMVLSNAISIEYIPNYKSDMGPEYFGSPFIMSTDTTWVNSFTGETLPQGLIFGCFDLGTPDLQCPFVSQSHSK